MKLWKHIDDHIETYLSSVLLLLFSVLIILQVIMRYIFNDALTWSEELSRFAFVWFVFTSASYAVRYQRHVKFNFLVNAMPVMYRLFIKFFALICWIAFLLFLDYYSVKLIIEQFHTQQLSPANKIPMYLIYIGLPLGSFLMTFRLVQHITEGFKEIKGHLVKE